MARHLRPSPVFPAWYISHPSIAKRKWHYCSVPIGDQKRSTCFLGDRHWAILPSRPSSPRRCTLGDPSHCPCASKPKYPYLSSWDSCPAPVASRQSTTSFRRDSAP